MLVGWFFIHVKKIDMKLDQFTFKNSPSLDFKEEAKVVTNKNSCVILLKDFNDNITVRKVIDGVVKSDCSFPATEDEKLAKYLKNIGKK